MTTEHNKCEQCTWIIPEMYFMKQTSIWKTYFPFIDIYGTHALWPGLSIHAHHTELQYSLSPSHSIEVYNDDVIKWKQFPCYWPFVREIHRSLVNSPHKSQWHGALMFSLICAWINSWVKQWWGCWFEMPSHPLWHHYNVCTIVDRLSQKACLLTTTQLIRSQECNGFARAANSHERHIIFTVSQLQQSYMDKVEWSMSLT